jgi:hypothetical protein
MACFLRMHSPSRRVLCRIPIYHSVPFHGGQQIPIAVAVYSALASVAKGEVSGSLGQRITINAFSTPSHVQLSGPRASSLKPSLKKCFSSDLLMPSYLAERNYSSFKEQESPAGIAKDSPRTAVRLAFCSCAGSILTDPVVQIPEQFHSADALA